MTHKQRLEDGTMVSRKFYIDIDPVITQEALRRGCVFLSSDGRVYGMTNVINRSLKNYLERLNP